MSISWLALLEKMRIFYFVEDENLVKSLTLLMHFNLILNYTKISFINHIKNRITLIFHQILSHCERWKSRNALNTCAKQLFVFPRAYIPLPFFPLHIAITIFIKNNSLSFFAFRSLAIHVELPQEPFSHAFSHDRWVLKT